ncbi:transcriptional regulator, LysR family [Methylophilus rhizosphaerae]|uniref:Transcriptional regulator, LysR family n=1 Tax=Methylophilus rhizosphaerae TaxID=492660 RepID=A0A1G9CZC9_9PROT|nr:LysR family transcriptional regulator [Methylophilus rhizosphaerae]SDK57048.1 transcriptional regulator, LysR family [Methylophilus rhizosphaerae]
MDITLARTFLEIIQSGSFIAAAERLHVTQTTITTRIKTLEELLGCQLFVRNRSGAKLTDNGIRFTAYAQQLVQTWHAARRDLPLPEGTANSITIGGEISLWNPLLLQWFNFLRVEIPSIAIRVEVSEAATLHKQLEGGVMDAALVHRPDYWSGMQIEELLEEKLIMVRSSQNPQPYIYIDWGDYFKQQHDSALVEFTKPGLSINLGPLALNHILEHGGSGYFRSRVVQTYIENGELEKVETAPEFSYPIYLMYPRNSKNAVMTQVLAKLRESSKKDFDWSQH